MIAKYLYGILAGMALCIGSFLFGQHYGKERIIIKNERAAWASYAEAVNTAMGVLDAFSVIATTTAQAMEDERKTTNQTVSAGIRYETRYVPVPGDTNCTLSPGALELRRCQIDRAYKALGAELPRDRIGVDCTATLSGDFGR